MSIDNGHPWLNNDNAKPADPQTNALYQEKSLSLDSRGIDARDIRRAVGEDSGLGSQDPVSAMQAFQRTLMGGDGFIAKRPPYPMMEHNNTSTVTAGSPFGNIPKSGFSYMPPPPLDAMGGASTHPFKATVTLDGADYVVSVEPDSFLFRSRGHTDIESITDLTTVFSADAGDSVYLEITFSDWPEDFTCALKVGTFPVGGEIEDDEEFPPVQTIGRIVLAEIVDVGAGVLEALQLTFTHLEMKLGSDAALPVNMPEAR